MNKFVCHTRIIAFTPLSLGKHSKQKNEMTRSYILERPFQYLCPAGKKTHWEEMFHLGARIDNSRQKEMEAGPAKSGRGPGLCCLTAQQLLEDMPGGFSPLEKIFRLLGSAHLSGVHQYLGLSQLQMVAAVLSFHCPVVLTWKNQHQSEQVLLMVLENRRVRKQLQG